MIKAAKGEIEAIGGRDVRLEIFVKVVGGDGCVFTRRAHGGGSGAGGHQSRQTGHTGAQEHANEEFRRLHVKQDSSRVGAAETWRMRQLPPSGQITGRAFCRLAIADAIKRSPGKANSHAFVIRPGCFPFTYHLQVTIAVA
ncbi:MAG: hypothetical protein ACKV2V_10865 [Blastocatellia bacterium]